MKTLYVSDLDGTLLDSSARVTDRSAEIISGLSRRGVLITVATARTPATVSPLLADTFILPQAVVMTGAAMWDCSHQRLTDVKFIPGEDVRTVCAAMTVCGVTPFIYTVGQEVIEVYHSAERLTDAERSFVDARLSLPLKRFYLATPVPDDCVGRAVLIFGIASAAEVTAAVKSIEGSTECSVSAYPDNYNPSRSLIEIFAPGVSKAEAVKRLAHRVGADRIVAFGDNLNDLPLLRAADVAVAVENALEEVKKEADVIIGPNYTDSVARYIASREDYPL